MVNNCKLIKNGFLTLILFLSTSLVFGQGIKFEHFGFEKAISLAKQQNKKVFVDCYTQWCGPCKRMAKTFFTDNKLGDFINSRFVAIKVDCGSKEGKEFGEIYKVNSYPTMILFENDGKELGRISGAKSDVELFIKTIKVKTNEEKSQIKEYYKRYESGERNSDFIREYIFEINAEASNLKSLDEKLKYLSKTYELFNWYKAIKPFKEWINKKDFRLIKMYGYTHKDIFDFVCTHKEKFEKIIPEKELTDYILNHVRFYTKSSVRHFRKNVLISYRQTQLFFPEIFQKNIEDFNYYKYNNLIRDAIRAKQDYNYLVTSMNEYRNVTKLKEKYSSAFSTAYFWFGLDYNEFAKEDIKKVLLYFIKESDNTSKSFIYKIKLYQLALKVGEDEMAKKGFVKLYKTAKRKSEYSSHIELLGKIVKAFENKK